MRQRRAAPAALLAFALALAATPVALAMGSNDDTADRSAKALERAVQRIEAKEYDAAIPLLERVIAQDADNADAHNWMGYALRNTGKFTESLQHYQRALAINPEHKGAHEYLGELYLMMGDVESAAARLETLAQLCPEGCEERAALEKAIADHKAGNRPS